MGLYLVEIKTYAVVEADDESHARSVADSHKREIFSDDGAPEILVHGTIASTAGLAMYGWDGMCLPYGGDGSTRIKDMLVPNS